MQDPCPTLSEKSDPVLWKIIPDPQHCFFRDKHATVFLLYAVYTNSLYKDVTLCIFFVGKPLFKYVCPLLRATVLI
jgi:hypothetical protein